MKREIMDAGAEVRMDRAVGGNARLIAAAPDLLEACRAANKWLGYSSNRACSISGLVLQGTMRAAIAKATSES